MSYEGRFILTRAEALINGSRNRNPEEFLVVVDTETGKLAVVVEDYARTTLCRLNDKGPKAISYWSNIEDDSVTWHIQEPIPEGSPVLWT